MELIQDFGPSDPPGQAHTFRMTGAGTLNGAAKKRGRGSGGPKTLFANKINASQSPSSARPPPRPAAPAAKIPKKAAPAAAPAWPRDAICESQEALLGLLDTLEDNDVDGGRRPGAFADEGVGPSPRGPRPTKAVRQQRGPGARDTLEEIDVARADDVDGGRRPGAFANEGFGPSPRASRTTKAGWLQRGPGARDRQVYLPAASPWLPRDEPSAQGVERARRSVGAWEQPRPRTTAAARRAAPPAPGAEPAAKRRRQPPPAAASDDEDCVVVGSRSAEDRDEELRRAAISVDDSDAEEQTSMPEPVRTLESHLKELRDGLGPSGGFDVAVALAWCEENGADELSEIAEVDMVDEFVASLELKPVKAKKLKEKLRAL